MENIKSDKPLSLMIRFWNHLPKGSYKYFVLYCALILFASFTEIFSIGAVLPFLGVLTNPEEVFKIEKIQPLIAMFGISSAKELILPVTVLFGLSAIIAGITRLSLLLLSTRITLKIGAAMSIDVYRKTMYQPYRVHVARNSSEVVTGVITKADGAMGMVLQPFLGIINAAFMLITLLIATISISPIIALTVFSSFGSIYLLIAFYGKKRLSDNGQIIAREQTIMMKSLQEGLGGIRDVLLDGTQSVFSEIYKNSDYPYRKACANNLFINNSPRFAIEALGMILLAGFAYSLGVSQGGLTSSIPVLGALALGAQRMLPILQQAYGSWAVLRAGKASVIDVLELLDQPLPDYANLPLPKPLPFQDKIQIKNLSFRYGDNLPYVLENLDFEIPKGSRIGFIGKTGSGKSTLLDILMALLDPTDGKIFIDGKELNSNTLRAWQANIAHVPQSIYLSDNTIAENIAFGIEKEKIDMGRVKKAAEKAQIAEHIEGLQKGYQTLVGERGIRLSGGQRQRIGIARALYKNATVIIFDEATSALDNETEKFVMEAIDGLGKDLTILIIAHRLSTIQNCDHIIEMSKGKIIRVGKYKELFQ